MRREKGLAGLEVLVLLLVVAGCAGLFGLLCRKDSRNPAGDGDEEGRGGRGGWRGEGPDRIRAGRDSGDPRLERMIFYPKQQGAPRLDDSWGAPRGPA